MRTRRGQGRGEIAAVALFAAVGLSSAAGCQDSARTATANAARDAERLDARLYDMLALIQGGLTEGAERMGSIVTDPMTGAPTPEAALYERRMRLLRAIDSMRQGRRLNFEVAAAPITVLAVVGRDGKILAGRFLTGAPRADDLLGIDLRTPIGAVGEALGGHASIGHGSAVLPGLGELPRPTAAVAVPLGSPAPAGALVALITFHVLAWSAERQFAAEGPPGKILPTRRVALSGQDGLEAGSIQPELMAVTPRAAARQKKLGRARSYAEPLLVQSRPFGMAVRTLPWLGEGAQLIVWRAEPP